MAVAELPASAKQGSNVLARKPRSLLSDSIVRLRKNRLAMAGTIFLTLVILAALVAPWITTGNFAAQDLLKNNAVPGWMLFMLPANAENYARIDNTTIFGFEHLGRDLCTRTVYGLISGYLGGKIDD
jgi:ABC-type dipeptide/oligopeptide/nickel transport system permease subunit